MLGRKGPWTVQQAKDWLRSHEGGEEIASTLEKNPSPSRQDAWVRMVMGMYSALYDRPAEPPCGEIEAADFDADDPEEIGHIDLAAWPARAAGFYP